MRAQEIGPLNKYQSSGYLFKPHVCVKSGRGTSVHSLWAGLLSAILLVLVAPQAHAAAGSGGGSKRRIDITIGGSFQNFDGVSGADFTSLMRMSYAGAFFYRYRPWWDNGLQFAMIPSISISPFVFSDNIVGNYTAKFYQYEYLTGIIRKKVRVHLIFGLEYFSLVGAPTLERGKQLKFYYGTQIAYDAFARHRLRIPVVLRVLKKPRRLYEFTNKPDDAIDVKAGMEYVLGTGLDFEF